jgi:hypothetical protein
MVWYDMMWYGMVWYGMIHCNAVWGMLYAHVYTMLMCILCSCVYYAHVYTMLMCILCSCVYSPRGPLKRLRLASVVALSGTLALRNISRRHHALLTCTHTHTPYIRTANTNTVASHHIISHLISSQGVNE